MKKRIWFFALCLCALTGVSAAQQRFRVEGNVYIVEGRNLSKFSCVRGFFNAAFANFEVGDTIYKAFLQNLGMGADTPASRIVTRAMFLDQALQTEVQDMRPYVNVDPVTYERAQYDWLRNQVPRLRAIYTQMIADLEQVGLSSDVIEKFIDQSIRPTITVGSNEPPTKEQEIMDLFEKTEVKKEIK